MELWAVKIEIQLWRKDSSLGGWSNFIAAFSETSFHVYGHAPLSGPHLPPFPSQEPPAFPSHRCTPRWWTSRFCLFPNRVSIAVAFRIQATFLSMVFKALSDLGFNYFPELIQPVPAHILCFAALLLCCKVSNWPYIFIIPPLMIMESNPRMSSHYFLSDSFKIQLK